MISFHFSQSIAETRNVSFYFFSKSVKFFNRIQYMNAVCEGIVIDVKITPKFWRNVLTVISIDSFYTIKPNRVSLNLPEFVFRVVKAFSDIIDILIFDVLIWLDSSLFGFKLSQFWFVWQRMLQFSKRWKKSCPIGFNLFSFFAKSEFNCKPV